VRCIAFIVDLTGDREPDTLVELTAEEQLQVLQVRSAMVCRIDSKVLFLGAVTECRGAAASAAGEE
jgi:hypothetical protein